VGALGESGGERMMGGILRKGSAALALLALMSLAALLRTSAQTQQAPPAKQPAAQDNNRPAFGPNPFVPPPAPKMNPRTDGLLDLSGYWVAVITEDWRYRMMTPDKGDYPGVPLNATARAIANSWDPAKDEASDNACKSYGAGAIMRIPTRLHITWVDDNTIKLETDAGEQTRLFHFYSTPPAGTPPSWQGYSVASFEGLRPRGFIVPVAAGSPGSRPAQEGYLKVDTTNLKPGYLRKNGVPYSAKAGVEEYFESFTEAGNTWLIVTSVVTDPEYLDQSFVTSSQFKKQADATGWNPTPCLAR
jgi:hypothetical protein